MLIMLSTIIAADDAIESRIAIHFIDGLE